MLDYAQTWFLLLGLFTVLFLIAIRLFIPSRLELTPRVGDYFAETLARAFYKYDIGVTPESCDEDVVELRWRSLVCGSAEALSNELNDVLNDGWEVYKITPLGGTGKFLLVMSTDRDYITDEDDAYGEPEEAMSNGLNQHESQGDHPDFKDDAYGDPLGLYDDRGPNNIDYLRSNKTHQGSA